jgi:pilus assembly protein CpaB
MSRARRSALLIGLALILGSLAAADVSRREAALRARLGPVTERVVAARDLPAGRKLRLRDLAVRRLPERYAPPDAASSPAELAGQRLAVPATAGGYVGAAQVRIGGAGAPVRAGERTTELIAVGSPEWVVPGARVDVLVTRERGDGGSTRVPCPAMTRRPATSAWPRRCGSACAKRSTSPPRRPSRARSGCCRARRVIESASAAERATLDG